MLAALAIAAPASGRTIYVDDDGAQCPQATLHTVQAAVNAAQPNDTIRVCRGTYREQVVIPEGKDGIRLMSLPQTPGAGAVLKPPPGGLAFTGAPNGSTNPLAILVLRAHRLFVRGFLIEGPLDFANPSDCAEHTHASGIAAPGGSATIDSNHITGIVAPCTGASGIHIGDVDSSFEFEPGAMKIDRNRIDGYGTTGVLVEGFNPVLIQRNVIVGRQGQTTGIIPIKENFEGPSPVPFAIVRSNDISDNARGIEIQSADARTVLVQGNAIHDNSVGLHATDGAPGEARGNLFQRNGTAILFEPFEPGTGWLVRLNRVFDSTSDGIHIRPLFGGQSGMRQYQLVNNRVLGSGGLDCFDETTGTGTAGTNDIWSGNVGVTDQPNVCRPP